MRKCVTGRLYNSNNIATSAALAKVCALLSASLVVNKTLFGFQYCQYQALDCTFFTGVCECVHYDVNSEYHAATVAFAMLGKLFISMTFSCIYVYSSELFPTEVRNVGMGTASMCARISSMASSYAGRPLVSDVFCCRDNVVGVS